jgi:hypothetical protein
MFIEHVPSNQTREGEQCSFRTLPTFFSFLCGPGPISVSLLTERWNVNKSAFYSAA